MVRPGMEGELSKKELALIKKGGQVHNLDLLPNGRFLLKDAIAGKYTVSGDRVRFVVEVFGGQTLPQMRANSESNGRVFGLAFLFDPFELVIVGESLVTPDPNSVLYTEYLCE